MTRISLTEQYNNKDVVEQIYDIKDRLTTLEDAQGGGTSFETRITALETANSTKTGQITALQQADTAMSGRITVNEGAIADNKQDIEDLEDELAAYQPLSGKDAASGYAGLDANTKIPSSKLYIGSNLDQILVAGAQLLQNEVLYVDSNGKIRSRSASGSTTYMGRYSAVASLPSSGVSNGDWATVYGASPQTDDGMYVYSTNVTPAAWEKATLFDATDYELVANLVTSISGASDNSHYPSAKAVYDLHNSDSVHALDASVVSASTTETVSLEITAPDSTVLASDSFVIQKDASVTSGSLKPVTSGAVYSMKTSLDTAIAAKLDATKCTYQTTAPTSAITDGGVHIVFLSAEPDTKYNGYIYLIASE